MDGLMNPKIKKEAIVMMNHWGGGYRGEQSNKPDRY